MLKTNKEIEELFDKNFAKILFKREKSKLIKSFIHQTRIADLEEMERMIFYIKNSHKCSGIDDIFEHIQKVKEEVFA